MPDIRIYVTAPPFFSIDLYSDPMRRRLDFLRSVPPRGFQHVMIGTSYDSEVLDRVLSRILESLTYRQIRFKL
jgi:hypothetical protein